MSGGYRQNAIGDRVPIFGILLIAAGVVVAAQLVLLAAVRRLYHSDLEARAVSRDLVYLPARREVVEQAWEWSRPVRIRCRPTPLALLWDLEIQTVDENPAE